MPAAASALLLGALAGLGVAVPVGPVGVLLLRTGLLHGTRVAVGAAAGVASVDTAYGVLAVAAGAPVGRLLSAHDDAVRLVSGGVLLVVGLALLRQWWRQVAAGPTTSDSPAVVPVRTAGPRARSAYVRFAALTAVNPLTALTSATVAVGLAARVGERPGAGVAVAFVVGVGAASLAWQLVLAVLGGRLGDRLGPRGRSRTSLLGALVVVALAVLVVVG